ncbi:MAG: hypothetical protein HY064_08610 [Bacteroidetes bacterium]|nr:hypothetical protein [Bacteroidota bacterium]
MKKIILLFAILATASAGAKNFIDQSDSTGLPGDNFDLYGALDLFKQSSSPEDFEKKINDPANQVNNLDLDQDGNVDYVQVIDNNDGDAHALELKVAVSATEMQDVAVIELEKNGDASADAQVVGDEELYGANYIVEAKDETSSTATDGKLQGFRPVVFVNVWMWSCVKFIYAPGYVLWISPWHYHYFPPYWHPWHPCAWGVYHGYCARYHRPCYHCVHECRMTRANVVYANHRTVSADVHRRNEVVRQQHAENHAANHPNNNAGKKGAPNGGAKNTGTAKQAGGAGTRGGGGPKGGAKQGGAGPRGGGGGHAGGGAGPRGAGGGGHAVGGHGGGHR